jgi:hypothetical protein
MSEFATTYKSKFSTPADAVGRIASGVTLSMGMAMTEPPQQVVRSGLWQKMLPGEKDFDKPRRTTERPADVADSFHVGRSTVYRALARSQPRRKAMDRWQPLLPCPSLKNQKGQPAKLAAPLFANGVCSKTTNFCRG